MTLDKFLARLCALVPARLSHDPILRSVRESPSPPRSHHSAVCPRAPAARTRPRRRRERWRWRGGRSVVEAAPPGVGQPPRPGLGARHHAVPQVRRPHARPRGGLGPRRHRACRPRCASPTATAPSGSSGAGPAVHRLTAPASSAALGLLVVTSSAAPTFHRLTAPASSAALGLPCRLPDEESVSACPPPGPGSRYLPTESSVELFEVEHRGSRTDPAPWTSKRSRTRHFDEFPHSNRLSAPPQKME